MPFPFNEVANHRLLEAARAGNSNGVLQALNDNANPNLQDVACAIGNHRACSMLHHAVWVDSAESVRYLLKHGADVNARTPYHQGNCFGDTPLHWATVRGDANNFEILRLLMENGAIHLVNHAGHLPIQSAVVTSNPQKADFIAGFQIETAKQEARQQIVDKEKFERLEAQIRELRQQLQQAAVPAPQLIAIIESPAADKLAKVRLLLTQGIDPNRGDVYNRTPLHMASFLRVTQSAELIALLLDNRADPALIEANGWTPVQYAIYNNNQAALDVYIARRLVNQADLVYAQRHQPSMVSQIENVLRQREAFERTEILEAQIRELRQQLQRVAPLSTQFPPSSVTLRVPANSNNNYTEVAASALSVRPTLTPMRNRQIENDEAMAVILQQQYDAEIGANPLAVISRSPS